MADMTNTDGVSATGGLALASFEKELVCSICTEILYQPLTILNCLHTFCGSCLKEWFSHQHRKASSSRAAPSTANPYNCPTCRAEVRDVQHNATVSNLLEFFLMANPSRNRTQEEKDEMDGIYKPDGTRPGDRILPKVERRRDKRSRRDGENAAREQEMIEEARQRSLRDIDIVPSANNLAPPSSDRVRVTSRDREERRHRRRDRERQRDNDSTPSIPSSTTPQSDRQDAASPPATSPRHPDAVEARQREHRMSHQASLRSLVSASDGTTGTGDSLDEARIMKEIIDEGLLGDIDIDTLTEAEQDALAERIADLYRQRHPRRTTSSNHNQTSHASPTQDPYRASNDNGSRRQRSDQLELPSIYATTDARDRSQPGRPQNMPPSTLVRSNSQGSSVTLHHSRRASDNTRSSRATGRSRATSVERPPTTSTTHLAGSRSAQSVSLVRRSSTNTSKPTTLVLSGESDRTSETCARVPPPSSPARTQSTPVAKSSQHELFELDGAVASLSVSSTSYPEPSFACFRCGLLDIQYTIHKHCNTCNVDLCMSCYRQGKGCNHWFGFGHTAEVNFENSKLTDDSTEPPHALVGRLFGKPLASTLITTKPQLRQGDHLPIKSTSNPIDRLQEGHFCDRCGNFANSQFWLCDICNDGEWGFCKACVDAHHCCTHPLLPVAYYPQTHYHDAVTTQAQSTHPLSLQPSLMSATGLRVGAGSGLVSGSNSRPQTPSSVLSGRSHRGAGYDYLSINVNCDTCHQIILPSDLRYHCPFHSSDFDICTSCYESFVFHARSRRDGNAAADMISGWRKCPAGHRMIVVTFEADISDEGDGGMRRTIKHDLVGGWKMSEADIRAWNSQQALYASPPTSPPLTTRGTWSWKEDTNGARRGTRSRASTLTNSNNSVTPGTSTKFPPDGGFGKSGQAHYAYWPEDGDAGIGELRLPRGAEVAEIEDVNGDWWSGVYAGDVGVFPFGYVREYR